MDGNVIVFFAVLGFVLLFLLTILLHTIKHLKDFKENTGNVESFKLMKKMKK